MSNPLIEMMKSFVERELESVSGEHFERHVGALEEPEEEHLYVVVERSWAHLDVELDELFEEFPEYKKHWDALYKHLDEQGLRATQSPPTDAVVRFAERQFRDRLEQWAESEDVVDYSRVAHDVYFSQWWKLSDEEYYALDERGMVADLESARQSLVLLARRYSTPGLTMERMPTETEWGFIWQQYAWEGIVERMLPVGNREQREAYESWAETAHRSSFRDVLNEFFYDAARDFISIVRRVDGPLQDGED